jgi:hypothetical protein
VEVVEGLGSEAKPGQKYEILREKETESKTTGVVAQVIECLPSKHKVLSLVSSTARRQWGAEGGEQDI